MTSSEDRQMVYNAIRTPDGTVLASFHRHDYKTHQDKNGKEYMIDGGLDYIRTTVNGDEEMLTMYLDEPFEKIRQYFHWGRNYDANMELLPRTEWIPLMDITDSHLDALLVYPRVTPWVMELFEREYRYRASKK